MSNIIIYTKSIKVRLDIGPDISDITSELDGLITDSNIITGSITASIVGSTGSISTIEFEPGVVEDLKRAIERMAPRGHEYEHELAWQDGNGHSHVQAALLGPSITLPVRNGCIRLGTWQQVVTINHDNRPRNRSVEITIIGTPI